MTKSKQPRVDSEVYRSSQIFYRCLKEWVENAEANPPTYSGNSRVRDRWLRMFWKREPYLAGVLKSVVDIDKNRGWELVGGRNQVRTYSQILRNAEPTKFDDNGMPEDGLGWRYYFSQQSLSYYTADIGSISEIGRDIYQIVCIACGQEYAEMPDRQLCAACGKIAVVSCGIGPMRGLWHVDPTRAELTGVSKAPIRYYPSEVSVAGNLWCKDDLMREVSMPSTNEDLRGLGYCAVSRVLEFARIMVAIYEHTLEKLFAKVPKGLLLFQGITDDQWLETMDSHRERLTAEEREFYSGLTIFFSDEAMDAKLIALSQLPDGFELETVTNLMMYAYALAFGYDPREFFPVSGGTLGTGKESEIQAIKASGKGGLDFILAYQDNLQRELPETLHWEFEQRNEQGEMVEAEVAESWARAINEMAAPSGPGLEATLTIAEKRQLLARKGLIPEDWTMEDEPEIATDTDSGEVDRTRATRGLVAELWEVEKYHDTISRCAEVFPDEPIIKYSWPFGREKLIFDPLAIRPSYHTLSGYISRSREDYARRIRNFARALLREAITPFEFVDNMTTVITQNFRLAWVEGAKQMGFSEGEIEPEDYEPLEKVTNNEFTFLPNLVRFIEETRQAGGTASDLEYRITQWSNRYDEVKDTAITYFGKNSKLLWRYDPVKEHCQDCANLDGQVRRANFWQKKELHPKSMKLQCGPGRVCGCVFEQTDLPVSKGRLPNIVGPGRCVPSLVYNMRGQVIYDAQQEMIA